MPKVKRRESTKAELRQQMKEYLARWKFVNKFILKEDRHKSLLKRYHEFLAMVRLTKAMNWRSSTVEEDAAARERWRRIREVCRG